MSALGGAGIAFQAYGAYLNYKGTKRDARLLRAQARAAGQQSVQDADAISREYRQIAGRQAAAMAQSGGGYEGSNAKLLHQSESLAYLDRLNTLYHGTMRRMGINAEAKATRRRANIEGVAALGSMFTSIGGMGS